MTTNQAARGSSKAAHATDWALIAAIAAIFLVSRTVWLVIAQAQGHDLFDITCRWDCAYYIDIADNGYAQQPTNSRGEANWGRSSRSTRASSPASPG